MNPHRQTLNLIHLEQGIPTVSVILERNGKRYTYKCLPELHKNLQEGDTVLCSMSSYRDEKDIPAVRVAKVVEVHTTSQIKFGDVPDDTYEWVFQVVNAQEMADIKRRESDSIDAMIQAEAIKRAKEVLGEIPEEVRQLAIGVDINPEQSDG